MHDETTLDASGPGAVEAQAYLAVMTGDRRDLVPIPPNAEVSIGRSRSCHVVLPDRQASRLQATLRWEHGQLWLTDRDSRNGTFLANKRVTGRVALRPGDVIRVGGSRMAVIVEPEASDDPDTAVIADARMKALVEQLERVAASDSNILLMGETGTGKEVLARRLHHASPRRRGPFVAINCGAIPEALAESVLFGHEPGAFTGATSRKPGIFEASSGGTLFLDEVGELSERMQARLLRVLESGELMRVGGLETIEVDLRVVSATHRDIESAPDFRQDLFFRLGVVRLVVPPLRERPADIEALAHHFLRAHGGGRYRLSADARRALREHSWPGNVRELRNALQAAIALTRGTKITARDLALGRPVERSPLDSHVHSVVRERIEAALDACGGNQSAAARRLGISRRALIYRMEKVGLKPKPRSAKG